MAPPPDHHSTVGLLRRFVALRQGGRPIPADVVEDVLSLVFAWTQAADRGEFNAVLPRPAEWRDAKLDERNRALRSLWNLTSGPDRARARQVEAWLEAWHDLTRRPLTGRDARHLLDAIPPAAVPHLEQLESDAIVCGRTIARACDTTPPRVSRRVSREQAESPHHDNDRRRHAKA